MATARKITINPITRLEGHGKVTIHLNEQGEVEDARFHITQFRGFERFCHGRSLFVMRVCCRSFRPGGCGRGGFSFYLPRRFTE